MTGWLERARERGEEDTLEYATNMRSLEREHEGEPERDFAVDRCIKAWSDLNTCRYIGMAVGMIPWTAIDAWADRHGLDQESALLLIDVIRLLDCDRSEREAAKAVLKKTKGPDR
jgi:hypothetical protein